VKFCEAYEALKQGALIKCPEWAGYWKWEDDSIKIYCKDGTILDIRETIEVDYTISFLFREDWEFVGSDVKDLFQTFTFSEAIRRLKRRERVARKGWNGKEMYLTLIPAGNAMYQGYDMQNCIGMKTADNKMQPGWVPSQADMLVEDWIIVI